jgi:type I restriction enzyme S subunit
VTDSHVTILRANADWVTKPYFAYTMKRLQPVVEAAANGSTGQVELSRPYITAGSVGVTWGRLHGS